MFTILFIKTLFICLLSNCSPKTEAVVEIDEHIELLACKIFINEIFIKSFENDNTDNLVLNNDRQIINNFIDDIELRSSSILYDGMSYDVTIPYRDSVSIQYAIHENVISENEISELYDLHMDYQKKKNLPKDTIEICDINMFNKVSDINNLTDNFENIYIFKLNRSLTSRNNIYIQIQIKNRYDILEVYLVFNRSNRKFLRFFLSNW